MPTLFPKVIGALKQGALRAGRGAAVIYGLGLKLYNWLRGKYDVPTPPESSQLYGLVKDYTLAGYQQHDLPPGSTLPLSSIPISPPLSGELLPGDKVQYQTLVTFTPADGERPYSTTVYVEGPSPLTTQQVVQLALDVAGNIDNDTPRLKARREQLSLQSYSVQVMGVVRSV